MNVRAAEVVAFVAARRVLVAIVAVGLALRLGWVLSIEPFATAGPMTPGDQAQYFHHGQEIAAGRGYVGTDTGVPTAYYPIGYPASLAVLFWVVGHTPLPDNYLLAAQLLNVVLSTASIVLVYLLGRKLFGVTSGLLAAGILAVWPNLVQQVATTQLETTFAFWCLAALTILVLHDWSNGLPSTRRLGAFGAVLGVSVLVRPFSIWFLVATFAAALVAGARWRRAAVATAVPLAIVVAISAPWVVRNAIQMDAFVPTSTNTGDTLCIDRVDGADGGFRWADHEGCVDIGLPEVERNSGNTRKAIAFVLDDPVREIVQIGKRARLMFASDHDAVQAVNHLGRGDVLSASTVATYSNWADRYFWGVTLLAVPGLFVAIRRRHPRPELTLVLIALASLVGVPLLLWGNPRFHLPFSPLLAVLAGAALGVVIDRVSGGPPAPSRPAADPLAGGSVGSAMIDSGAGGRP